MKTRMNSARTISTLTALLLAPLAVLHAANALRMSNNILILTMTLG